MDEVLYYKAWVEELQTEILSLKADKRELKDRLENAKESVADSLSYYFENIARTVLDAQEEIREYMG